MTSQTWSWLDWLLESHAGGMWPSEWTFFVDLFVLLLVLFVLLMERNWAMEAFVGGVGEHFWISWNWKYVKWDFNAVIMKSLSFDRIKIIIFINKHILMIKYQQRAKLYKKSFKVILSPIRCCHKSCWRRLKLDSWWVQICGRSIRCPLLGTDSPGWWI